MTNSIRHGASRNGYADRRRLEGAVIDRLHQLQTILPAMAEEAATARRELARLRSENRRLTRRLSELEPVDATASPDLAA